MKALAAGSEVDSWCTKCRLDLNHKIVAIVQGRPKRVVCLTCGSQHNYRSPKGTQAVSGPARSPQKRAASGRPTARSAVEKERMRLWEEQVSGKSSKDFQPYSMESHFTEGDLVLHKKFGQGYIEGVREDGKVQVVFRDGARTLAHRSE